MGGSCDFCCVDVLMCCVVLCLDVWMDGWMDVRRVCECLSL